VGGQQKTPIVASIVYGSGESIDVNGEIMTFSFTKHCFTVVYFFKFNG
jgi:hypothetical protein